MNASLRLIPLLLALCAFGMMSTLAPVSTAWAAVSDPQSCFSASDTEEAKKPEGEEGETEEEEEEPECD